MPKVTADDFENDFEGALAALCEEAMERIEAIPPGARSDYFAAEAAARLARLINMRAPDIIIAGAEKTLSKRLRERAKARKMTIQSMSKS